MPFSRCTRCRRTSLARSSPIATSRSRREFIVQVIQQVRAAGFEIVSLDEAHFRLVEGEYGRPFVCFAFDDGYRDLYRARLSDLPALRPAVRLLRADRLSERPRRALVARAGAGHHQGGRARREDRRLAAAPAGAGRRPKRRRATRSSTAGSGRSTRTMRARSCASCAPASTSISPGSAQI